MRPTLLALAQVLAKPAVAIGGAYYLTNVSPSGAYTAAVEAPITQSVNVSGPVESAQNTDLSFQVPGQVRQGFLIKFQRFQKLFTYFNIIDRLAELTDKILNGQQIEIDDQMSLFFRGCHGDGRRDIRISIAVRAHP